ncbi:hypothetical protein GGI13_000090 [Coemansia sp. RSA 455]|nr:hypothetical protein GGI13_000090 [Coemansia sp. RSA 455]
MSAKIVERTEGFVREYMSKYDCSHDWQHVNRVVRLALALAKSEAQHRPLDMLVVHLAALLHDVDDAKYRQKGEPAFSSKKFLQDAGLDCERAELVCRVVDAVSFRKELLADEQDKNGTSDPDERQWRQGCPELACVQDADRLDAIGAFGVLRCAAFSGARNRTLHDPCDSVIQDITYEQYVAQSGGTSGTAVAHFHEKLLKLASMMKTERGRQEAQRRHDYLIGFLKQIDEEFNFAGPQKHRPGEPIVLGEPGEPNKPRKQGDPPRLRLDPILLVGNYSASMVKYQEPIRGKSWRALYKRYGFKVFLINEFRTSSYDGTTKRRRFNRNRVAVINFRRIVVSLRETGDIPRIFKPSTHLPDTRKKSNADKSELGEPGATTTTKGTVSNKPRSTAKRSRKQPVTAPSKTLDFYLKGEPATNKQQQQSSPLPLPQPKRLHKGTA